MKWPALSRKMVLRGRRPMHYGVKGGGSVWTGEVVHITDLTDEERADVGAYSREAWPTSSIPRMCANRWCRLWIGATLPRCPHCHTRQNA